MATKKTLGRRKIEIKKIERKSSKQVTFSKRRAGLFNKAGEISILCGAEIAVIVFSPNGKIFCFGHPSVDKLLDRFLNGDRAPPNPDLNASFAVAAAEESRNGGGVWWDEPMESMKLEELKGFRSALVELRARVEERAEELAAVRMGGPIMPALPPPPPSCHLAGNMNMGGGFGVLGFF